MDNWAKKEKLTKRAKEHTAKMETAYGEEIRRAIRQTIVYGEAAKTPRRQLSFMETEVMYMNTDTVSALFSGETGQDKTAVLNFASYKNPGGMFMNGSSAQEEMLCHESFLYNVLAAQKGYYAWNNGHKNRALYMNRALYSPGILFLRNGEERYADVITCAAPNLSAGRRYMGVSLPENEAVLRERIRFVRDIAEENEVRTLILGAYGCGVFGQDPQTVAKIFKEEFAATSVWKLIYAVPGKDRNAQVFAEHFRR